MLEKSDNVSSEIKSNLKSLKVTNLDRLISDPNVRNFLGIEINNGVIKSNVEQNEVLKGLTHIVNDLLDPKFNVKKIYTKEDRTDYINKIPTSNTPDIKKKTVKPWQFNSSETSSITTNKTYTNITPNKRKNLIPKNCKLSINRPKVNNIYHELLNLNVTNFTNATAVLFRVFVELSVDCYLEEHQLINTPSAAKSGLNFQQKINLAANHLETKKFADAAICKGIKSEIKDSNDIMGIDTWHAYVHNNKFSPKDKNLITTWDNIQSFIEVLWSNIK